MAGFLDKARSLRAAVKPTTPGAIDHAYNGLLAGWLACPECPADSPAPLIAHFAGAAVSSSPQVTPRPETPSKKGFVWRFPPRDTTKPATKPTTASISCSHHPDQTITTTISPETAALPAIARIEHSFWPAISGWVANLTGQAPRFTITVGDDDPLALPLNVDRPDVRAFLGDHGVHGFQVDIGALRGFALPDGAPITIAASGHVLANTQVTNSPLTNSHPCPDHLSATTAPMAEEMERLQRRFTGNFTAPAGSSWQDILRLAGMDATGDLTDQWARYFAHQGLSDEDIASAITLKQAEAWSVPHLDPRLPFKPHKSAQDATTHQKNNDDAPKVCVAGLVNHKSGLGQNARNSLAALELAGFHTCATPFFPQLGSWNPDLRATRESIEHFADHTVLLHLPADKVVSSLAIQPALLASPRLIGYFMWEVEVVPREFYRALDMMDEIWTATEFVANGFRAVTDTPVHVTGHAVDVSSVEEYPRHEIGIPEDTFMVHFSFDANSTIARKNPSAVVDAFHLAFDKDPTASLVLRIRNRQQLDSLAKQGDAEARGLIQRLADDPNIIVISEEMSYGKTLGLIQQADCYLSLHRSEGFGYTIAEAQLLGTPVIATNYSGNIEIMDPQLCTGITAELIDVHPGEYFHWEPGTRWANPDVNAAAKALTKLRDEGHHSPQTGNGVDQFTLASLSERYVDHLQGVTVG